MDLLVDIVSYVLLAFFAAASFAVILGWCVLVADEAARQADRRR